MARSKSASSPLYVVPPSKCMLRDMPDRIKPREELERVGVANISDDMLLAILLRSGARGINVVDLSKWLLKTYGSLSALAQSPLDKLVAVKGVGRVKAQVLVAAFELARRLSRERLPRRPPIHAPADVASLMRETVRILDHEVFWALLLDAKNQLQGQPVEVSRGVLDASLVHPREVFQRAMIAGSVGGIVLVHNHPSGDPTPSADDVRTTRQMVEAGRIIDIRVLDHVILGRLNGGAAREWVSMREEGVINFG